MSIFSDNLKLLRKVKHKTQYQISQELEITIKRYAKWEEDKSEPAFAELIKLAEYHGKTLDDLVRRRHNLVSC